MLGFAGFLAVTPVYLYEKMVKPELESLANTYSNFDQTAQEVARSSGSKISY